jgi:hypothetical protein
MVSPVAGLLMALRCVVVKRGGNKPLVVLLTSNSAEASGEVVPIPTWAFTPPHKALTINVLSAVFKNCFFMVIVIVWDLFLFVVQ